MVEPGDTLAGRLRASLSGDLGAGLAVGLAYVVLASWTWRRLGGLTIDTGRELEVALRMVEGQVLYRDVRYYWGPLAPAVNALLYGTFGVHLDVLLWTGTVVAGLTAAGVYLLARTGLPPWIAGSVSLAFLTLCAFAQMDAPIFNFVLPHNFSATYGTAAAIWSVWLLTRYVASGRLAWLAGSMAAAVMACLTKGEIAVPVLAVHAIHLAAAWRRFGRAAWGLLAGAAAVVGLVYGGLHVAVGAPLWRENLAFLANPASRHFIRLTMGLDDPQSAAVEVGLSLLLTSVVLVPLAVHASTGGRLKPWLGGSAALVWAAGVLSLFHPQFSMRALPVVLVAGLVLAGIDVLGGRSDQEHLTPLLVIAFGLLSLSRIPLQVGPRGYGYYLLAPALPAVSVAAGRAIPRLFRGGAVDGRLARFTVAGVMIGLSVAALRLTAPLIERRTMLVEGPRGSLFLPPGQERSVVEWLSKFPAGTSILALPDAAALSFLSGHRAGRIPVLTYVPMTIPDGTEEARILRGWSADPPDVVVWGWKQLDTKDVFGTEPLGSGYGASLRDWLEKNYAPVNPSTDAYVLLVRRP